MAINTGTAINVSVMNSGIAHEVPPPMPRLAPSLCTTLTTPIKPGITEKLQPSASAKCFVRRSAASIAMPIPRKSALFQPKHSFILRPIFTKKSLTFIMWYYYSTDG